MIKPEHKLTSQSSNFRDTCGHSFAIGSLQNKLSSFKTCPSLLAIRQTWDPLRGYLQGWSHTSVPKIWRMSTLFGFCQIYLIRGSAHGESVRRFIYLTKICKVAYFVVSTRCLLTACQRQQVSHYHVFFPGKDQLFVKDWGKTLPSDLHQQCFSVYLRHWTTRKSLADQPSRPTRNWVSDLPYISNGQ
jgi:hypothetical protein